MEIQTINEMSKIDFIHWWVEQSCDDFIIVDPDDRGSYCVLKSQVLDAIEEVKKKTQWQPISTSPEGVYVRVGCVGDSDTWDALKEKNDYEDYIYGEYIWMKRDGTRSLEPTQLDGVARCAERITNDKHSICPAYSHLLTFPTSLSS